jgi:hypothetical protein
MPRCEDDGVLKIAAYVTLTLICSYTLKQMR